MDQPPPDTAVQRLGWHLTAINYLDRRGELRDRTAEAFLNDPRFEAVIKHGVVNDFATAAQRTVFKPSIAGMDRPRRSAPLTPPRHKQQITFM